MLILGAFISLIAFIIAVYVLLDKVDVGPEREIKDKRWKEKLGNWHSLFQRSVGKIGWFEFAFYLLTSFVLAVAAFVFAGWIGEIEFIKKLGITASSHSTFVFINRLIRLFELLIQLLLLITLFVISLFVAFSALCVSAYFGVQLVILSLLRIATRQKVSPLTFFWATAGVAVALAKAAYDLAKVIGG